MKAITDPAIVDILRKYSKQITNLTSDCEEQGRQIKRLYSAVEAWKQRYIGVVVAMSDPSDVDLGDLADEIESMS